MSLATVERHYGIPALTTCPLDLGLIRVFGVGVPRRDSAAIRRVVGDSIELMHPTRYVVNAKGALVKHAVAKTASKSSQQGSTSTTTSGGSTWG